MSYTASQALKRIALYLSSTKMSQEEFLDITGLDWNQSTLSRYLANPPKDAALSKEEKFALNDFIISRRLDTDVSIAVDTIGLEPDHPYFSLLNFLRFSSSTEVETKKLALGLYRLYRPSLKIPKSATVGLFSIKEEGSGALSVHEIRHYRGATNGGFSAERSIYEEFEGYMIRKRRRYICFQRNKIPSNPNFMIAIFNDEFIDNDEDARIFSLGGMVLGVSGSRTYISKVFIERCEYQDIDKLSDEIDYVPIKNLKPSVKNYLRMEDGGFFHVF